MDSITFLYSYLLKDDFLLRGLAATLSTEFRYNGHDYFVTVVNHGAL